MLTIKIIHPASRALDDTLKDKIRKLENSGLDCKIACDFPEGDTKRFWLAHSSEKRLPVLRDALFSETYDVILCGRGGYGMSDLLEEINWRELTFVKPKIVVGFSDISSLLSKIYRELLWPAIHGPMINTDKWQDLSQSDLTALTGLFVDHQQVVTLTNDSRYSDNIVTTGPLFGGCLSVLTNLIGTNYLPVSLKNHILFFEDIAEPLPRVLRNLRQWKQSGLIDECQAIVLGQFEKSRIDSEEMKSLFVEEVKGLTNKPVYLCRQFGHGPINFPIQLGALAEVDQKGLRWQWNHKQP